MNKVFSLLLSCPHDDKYWQRLSATSRCCKPEYAGYLIIPWMFQKCMRNIWLYLLHFVNNWSIWLWRCILHLTFQKNLHSVMPYINVLIKYIIGLKYVCYFDVFLCNIIFFPLHSPFIITKANTIANGKCKNYTINIWFLQ